MRQVSPRLVRRLKIAAIILLMLLGADLILVTVKWPFSENAIISSMGKLSGCDVKISRFEKIFIPHPGYVVDGVVFTRNGKSGNVTLASIGRLDCEASWLAILTLTHRISRIRLEGARFIIPKQVPPPVHKNLNAVMPTTVTDLFAPGAVLEIDRGSTNSRFDFPQLHLSNLARDKPIKFQMRITSRLIGTADAGGSVGPLQLKDVKGTRLSGAFRLSNLDLSAYQEISGTASASGRFEGQLKNVEVRTRVAIPDFEVKHSGHAQGLTAECRAIVDGTHGDIAIDSAAVHVLSSTLLAHGSIRGAGGKTIDLDIDGLHTAIEDLLRLFVKSDPPPMTGALTMHTHVTVPPGAESFLRRVRLDGDFQIVNGSFSKQKTEEAVCELSARASGRKNQKRRTTVPVETGSHVELRDEIAMLSRASFAVPGAIAKGGGTYDLRNEAIDFRGKLAMQASLSKAATGIKSVLAIPLDPFFKKHGSGAVIPVRMTGTYTHPKFKMLL